jgi:hypothetical protein
MRPHACGPMHRVSPLGPRAWQGEVVGLRLINQPMSHASGTRFGCRGCDHEGEEIEHSGESEEEEGGFEEEDVGARCVTTSESMCCGWSLINLLAGTAASQSSRLITYAIRRATAWKFHPTEHPMGPVSGELGWAGCGPRAPTWPHAPGPLGSVWPVTPTGTGAGSSASSVPAAGGQGLRPRVILAHRPAPQLQVHAPAWGVTPHPWQIAFSRRKLPSHAHFHNLARSCAAEFARTDAPA